MSSFVLCCALLLGADLPGPTQYNLGLSAYQAAKAQAGADAEANVRLALWCEAHGMTAERLAHLSVALLSNPARAREILGWQPQVGLREGLERVVAFMKEHPRVCQEGQAYAI